MCCSACTADPARTGPDARHDDREVAAGAARKDFDADCEYASRELERQAVEPAGFTFHPTRPAAEDDVITKRAEANALLGSFQMVRSFQKDRSFQEVWFVH